MELCLSSPLTPACPRHSSTGSLPGPSSLCSPPHLAQSACLLSLPEQLSYAYKSSLQFHSFQSSLLPAPTLNLTLHKSISKGAGEQRKSGPFAMAGQSWVAHAKRCGAGGGSLSPATTCPLYKTRGAGGGPWGESMNTLLESRRGSLPCPELALCWIVETN